MNTLFIALQSTYQDVEIALFNNQEQLFAATESKLTATKNLIFLIQTLLNSHKLSLKDLTFIAVNKGPGPFTTLRTIVTSVNGLNYATHIPLVSVNGLEAFAQQYRDPLWPNTTYMLNAFGQDVYFYHQRNNAVDTYGCQSITQLLNHFTTQEVTSPIRFLGNGTLLHQTRIQECLGEHAYIPSPLPEYCSIEQIARTGLTAWRQNSTISGPIYPYYLKNSWPIT